MKIKFDLSKTAQNNDGWYFLLLPTIICGSFESCYEFGLGWMNFIAVIVLVKEK
jgi:hypothetical protein